MCHLHCSKYDLCMPVLPIPIGIMLVTSTHPRPEHRSSCDESSPSVQLLSYVVEECNLLVGQDAVVGWLGVGVADRLQLRRALAERQPLELGRRVQEGCNLTARDRLGVAL